MCLATHSHVVVRHRVRLTVTTCKTDMDTSPSSNHGHTELIWEGKFEGSAELPPKRAVEKITLPFQAVEVINEPREGTGEARLFTGGRKEGWRNKLIWGDNELAMSSLLEEYAGKVDLIYIDPPFDVGADFSVRVKVGDEEVTKEPSILEEKAYRDTWGRGTNSYLQMVYERLSLMRELLSERGSLYVHLDWHVGHYVKVILDEIFGKENLVNEVIWQYQPGAAPQRGFGRKHDLIFLYSKSQDFYFDGDAVREPYSKKTLERLKYAGAREKNVQKVTERGGRIPTDVWYVPSVQGNQIEYQGFPTQKPEALLKRIIKASSGPGFLVADFFCGSGTSGVVAEGLGRRWIMCDLGRFAIHTSRKRLMEVQRKLKEEGKPYYPFEIINLGKYERQYWQVAVVNGGAKTAETKKIAQYVKFVVALYRGEFVSGFAHLHGKKEGRFVHVGAVDAPVTMHEIKEAVEECKKNKFSHLDVLGWEWEMRVNEEAVKEAKGQGVRLKLLQIPREVMDKRAVEAGDVKFFELNFVDFGVEKKGQEVRVSLKSFAIPSEDLIPRDLRERITNWADYIDYWSVDWDYESLKAESGAPVFQNDWQAFRTKKNPKLELETPLHAYPKKGKYVVLVKVIDIFGNDTSKAVEVRV